MFYRNVDGQKVQCLLCPRRCPIGEGKRGFCRNRENRTGKLYSVVHGQPAAVDIGPIEKAPLYHFMPGHSRLCLACASCNLRCKYCHNWHLSQKSTEELTTYSFTPGEILQQAKKHKVPSISFTYTEPTVYYRLTHLSPTSISTLEAAFEIARKNGLRYVYIGNVPGHLRNSTFCPSCGQRIIYRTHFDVLEMNVVKGKCKFCHQAIQGKWS